MIKLHLFFIFVCLNFLFTFCWSPHDKTSISIVSLSAQKMPFCSNLQLVNFKLLLYWTSINFSAWLSLKIERLFLNKMKIARSESQLPKSLKIELTSCSWFWYFEMSKLGQIRCKIISFCTRNYLKINKHKCIGDEQKTEKRLWLQTVILQKVIGKTRSKYAFQSIPIRICFITKSE